MQKNDIEPNYYAVIPANVRYDKSLPANAKILYAEITSLCNEKGYCWATNQYFADLYGLSKTSISRLISDLQTKMYVRVKIEYKAGTKEVVARRIYIANSVKLPNERINRNEDTPVQSDTYPMHKNEDTSIQNSIHPIHKDAKDNNKNRILNNNNNQSSPSVCEGKNRQDRQTDRNSILQEMEAYEVLLKENIDYGSFEISRPQDIKIVDEFIRIIIDTIMTNGGSVCIGGEEKPRALVAANLLKLNYDDIDHTLDRFKGITERIINKKQYILTMLYNCKMELDLHYTNLVKSDQWQCAENV